MPDLILMNLQRPVMNGYSAIEILKADPETKHLKIILVTSFAMMGDKEKIFEAGDDDYISKPLNTRKLPEIVKRILGQLFKS